jgi:hypothetical protein
MKHGQTAATTGGSKDKINLKFQPNTKNSNAREFPEDANQRRLRNE